VNFKNYFKVLKERLNRYFDIEEDYYFEGLKFEFFARSFVRNEKYILSKKLTIYGFENNEYCLVKYYPQIDANILSGYIDNLKCAVDRFVVPHEEHMSSVITGVLVVDHTPDRQLVDTIRKFKFHKGFAFGFKGWVDIRLILVDLSSGEITTNKKGKEVEKFYRIDK
jgi:hypothetical protein